MTYISIYCFDDTYKSNFPRNVFIFRLVLDHYENFISNTNLHRPLPTGLVYLWPLYTQQTCIQFHRWCMNLLGHSLSKRNLYIILSITNHFIQAFENEIKDKNKHMKVMEGNNSIFIFTSDLGAKNVGKQFSVVYTSRKRKNQVESTVIAA